MFALVLIGIHLIKGYKDFFFYLGFLSQTLTNHRTAEEGEAISLSPHRHLDISRAIIAESSPLHIASSRTRTGNLRFPSASQKWF